MRRCVGSVAKDEGNRPADPTPRSLPRSSAVGKPPAPPGMQPAAARPGATGVAARQQWRELDSRRPQRPRL